MSEEQLKEKHLEAIEQNLNQFAKESEKIANKEAAELSTQISLNYGKIQRLEGMIEVYTEWYGSGPVELLQQLEEMKNEL